MRNFRLASENPSYKRTDEDLIQRYSQIKESENEEASVLYNKGDLAAWNQAQTDNVIGMH